MKVTVDPVACEANAVCARLVPPVFSIYEDEEGKDTLAIANNGEVPAEHADGVRDAVSRCPRWPSRSNNRPRGASSWRPCVMRASVPGLAN